MAPLAREIVNGYGPMRRKKRKNNASTALVGGPEAAGGKACTRVVVFKEKPRVRLELLRCNLPHSFQTLAASTVPGFPLFFVLTALTQSRLLTCIPRPGTNPAPCGKASGTSPKQGGGSPLSPPSGHLVLSRVLSRSCWSRD